MEEPIVEKEPPVLEETELAKDKEVKKLHKRSKDEKNSRKKDEKSVEQVLKALNNLATPEEKLAGVCKKYTEILEEGKKQQLAAKVAEKKMITLQREKEQLQAEQSKAVLTRSRLENLCRELQRQNKAMKEESLLRIREEEEKRKEVSAKFHATLADITSLMQQNTESNSKLRDENLEMQKKFKSVCEQYELREEQVDKISKQMKLESQLADARLRKAKMEMLAEKELLERDKQQLMAELALCHAKLIDHEKTEESLRAQINVYFEKYDEFQNVLTKSNQVYAGFKGEMEKMSKKITRLEKETSSWKQKWESSHKALLQLAGEKQLKDAEVQLQARQLAQLQKLCRSLQTERTALLQQLKGLGIAPTIEGDATADQEPPTPQRKTESPKAEKSTNASASSTATPLPAKDSLVSSENVPHSQSSAAKTNQIKEVLNETKPVDSKATSSVEPINAAAGGTASESVVPPIKSTTIEANETKTSNSVVRPVISTSVDDKADDKSQIECKGSDIENKNVEPKLEGSESLVTSTPISNGEGREQSAPLPSGSLPAEAPSIAGSKLDTTPNEAKPVPNADLVPSEPTPVESTTVLTSNAATPLPPAVQSNTAPLPIAVEVETVPNSIAATPNLPVEEATVQTSNAATPLPPAVENTTAPANNAATSLQTAVENTTAPASNAAAPLPPPADATSPAGNAVTPQPPALEVVSPNSTAVVSPSAQASPAAFEAVTPVSVPVSNLASPVAQQSNGGTPSSSPISDKKTPSNGPVQGKGSSTPTVAGEQKKGKEGGRRRKK